MAPILITLLLMLSSFLLTAGKMDHIIGPVAACSEEMRHPREFVENCFQRCRRPKAPAKRGHIELYLEVAESSGPKVVQCTKVMITQTFTETWTFTQLEGTPESRVLPMSPAECREAVKVNCPDLSCNIRAPHKLESEYHYASDTKLSRTFINIITLPSAIDMIQGEMRISPMGINKAFVMSTEEGSHDGHAFIWQKRDVTTCPFETATHVGCDYYDGDVDTLECRGSRIVIENTTKSIDLPSPCTGIKKSLSGFLYSWREGDQARDQSYKKLYLTEAQSETADTASLRAQTGHALSVIDEDICQVQCDLLDLQLQLNLGKEILTRLGNRYVLITKTGYARECQPLVACNLIKPHIYCGGPTRVGVTCGGKGWMWNPLKSYVENGTVCHRVMRNDTLMVSIGGKRYDISQDMHINMDSIDEVGLAPDLMTIQAVKVDKNVISAQEMRESWISGPHYAESNKSLLSAAAHEVDHWDLLGEGWMKLTGWGRVITDLLKKTYVVILICITVLSVLWYLSKVQDKNRNDSHVVYHLSAQNPREEQPVWM